jgi:3-isopropylmalate/(R)-2-methylmalate dehydratase large subunit
MQSLATTVLKQKSTTGSARIGEIIFAVPDLILMHDRNFMRFTAQMAAMGVDKIAYPERSMVAFDHEIPPDTAAAAEIFAKMRRDAARLGITRLVDIGDQGISHQVAVERGFAPAGSLILGSDTHTPTAGATGCLAISVSNWLITALVLGECWLQVPETIRLTLTGMPSAGVMSRDLAMAAVMSLPPLELNSRVVEFGGPLVRDASLDQRLTLCNVFVETGVEAAIVDVNRLDADPAAIVLGEESGYALNATFDVSNVEPQIAPPPHTTASEPVSHFAGTPIQQAFIGSCASGRVEDFDAAAEILAGRKVADGVRLFVTPASQDVYRKAAASGALQVLSDAGAIVTLSTCAPCFGRMASLAGGETCISTGTRNDPGRNGSRDANTYLASAATVAASAVAGRIMDPREMAGS